MRLLTYTNSRGESLVFRSGSSFVISQINGLGDVEADVQMQQAPYQDGATPIDVLLEPRYINFEVFIQGKGDTDISQKRSRLARVFNPKLRAGLFEYQYGDIHRQIYAIAESVPHFPTGEENRGRTFQKALINLTCPNPYWKSPAITEEPMAAFVPLFKLPIRGPFMIGLRGHERTLMNNSDSPVPIRIKIKGPTVNPQLTNETTGETIKVNRELSSDDVLEINTDDDNKYILLNGENAFHWIDLNVNSTFWKLREGENRIKYTADSGIDTATLTIDWQEQYVGV